MQRINGKDLPYHVNGTVARSRIIVYVATFAALFFDYFYLRDSNWRGDIWQHTLTESVTAVLSFCVGCLALVRFYSKKNNTFLFIGTGFVATAFLDGYHAVVTSSYFITTFPSSPPSLIAWSWFASRTFLAVLLWLSWLLWKREDRLGAAGRVSERLVYVVVSMLAFACFAITVLTSMPTAYHQFFVFSRPQELVSGLFFLLALIGYLRKGKWKTDPFEHWLVLSLIIGFMGQVMFMALSSHLYDMMFDVAHVLKGVSYICVLIGLLFDMYFLFSESVAQQDLALKNSILMTQQEVSLDAILVVNEQGKIISYNHRFVKLWDIPLRILATLDAEPVLQLIVGRVHNPEAFLARIRHLYANMTENDNEEIELKDGRIVERYSAPMVGENAKYYGRVWYFREITERKRIEREMQNLQEQLRDQAAHDPLTGLYNRRYLEDTIGRELIRAARYGHPIGIVMCDVDHFKTVNDAHGHLVGDEVLRVLADLVNRNTRGSDIACRYGGEEFLLLLPDASPELAYQRAEQLRAELEATPIVYEPTAIRVTASFGVAAFPDHGSTLDELIRAADEALYMAKNAGRNRVVLHPIPGA